LKSWYVVATVLFVTPIVTDASTVISADGNDGRYFAHNLDHVSPAYMWVQPPEPRRYGRVSFGFRDQQALSSMNDQGLCFAAVPVAHRPWPPEPWKSMVGLLPEIIMNTCATVEEALERFETYHCKQLRDTQYMFFDSTGAAAIVAGLPGGEISILHREGPALIMSNQRLEATAYRCPRYVRAEQLLAGAPPSLDGVRNALEATYQQGATFSTVSILYEPAQARIQFYHLGHFEESRSFSLEELFERGNRPVPVADLFEATPYTLHEFRQRKPRIYETRIPLPAQALSEYAGHYEGEHGPLGEIAVAGDGLSLTPPRATALSLWPEGRDRFRLKDGRMAIFQRNEGAIMGMALLDGNEERYSIRRR